MGNFVGNKYKNYIFGDSLVMLFSFITNNLTFQIICLIYFSIVLAYTTRKNILVFMSTLMIAYSNYGIIVFRYIKQDSIYYSDSKINSGIYDILALRICILLLFVILCFCRKYASRSSADVLALKNTNKNHTCGLLVVASCCILILIWNLYYKFSFGERAVYSPMYEYSTIFFILAIYYSGNKLRYIIPVLAIALFYVFFDFAGGQRSTGMQITIIIAIMFLGKYLSVSKIFIYGLLILIVLRFVAVFRSSFFAANIHFSDIFSGMVETMFAPDTSGYAYYTSLTYLATMDIYDFQERLAQFEDFFVSLFSIGGVGEALPYISLRHFQHGFGGILGIYMYYYLGYLGTILIGCLVGSYYKMMYLTSSLPKFRSYKYLILVYVASTTLRWYNYSPFQLIKGVIIIIIISYFYHLLYNLLKR